MIGKLGGTGPDRLAKFRVAKVSRPLMCVADMVDQNQMVVFDKDSDGADCSYIYDKTSKSKYSIPRRNKIYELEMHVPRECPFKGHPGRE